MFSLILIAISLSFDTLAVSISTGLIVNKIRFWNGVKVATVLAFFQTLMPAVGWFAGSKVADNISSFDHWIAFGLLSIIGVMMIIESLKKEEVKTNFNPLKFITLIGMGIATSIDALVVGISFAFMEINIYLTLFIVGAITFLTAMLGMLFGKNIGIKFGKKMETLGGIILIIIGLKILISDLFF